MIYMSRLGIWGEGTPFRTFDDFLHAIEKRFVFPRRHCLSCESRVISRITAPGMEKFLPINPRRAAERRCDARDAFTSAEASAPWRSWRWT